MSSESTYHRNVSKEQRKIDMSATFPGRHAGLATGVADWDERWRPWLRERQAASTLRGRYVAILHLPERPQRCVHAAPALLTRPTARQPRPYGLVPARFAVQTGASITRGAKGRATPVTGEPAAGQTIDGQRTASREC